MTLCGQRLFFYLGERVGHRRDEDDGQRECGLGNKVGGVVAERVLKGGRSLRGIGAEEDNAGDNRKEVTAEHTCEIAKLQAVLFPGKESGQAECPESAGVVDEHLRQRIEYRFRHKLKQTVGNRSHNTDIGAVPIADQDNKEHAQQGDGAAHGQIGKFNQGADRCKRDCRGGKYQLPGGKLCLFDIIFVPEYGCGNQKNKDKCRDDQNACRGHAHGAVTPGSFGGGKKIVHKKILLANRHARGISKIRFLTPVLSGSSNEGR